MTTSIAREQDQDVCPVAHRAVFIALSAGGLEPLRQILRNLPRTLPAAVVVVSHRSRRQPNMLTKVLGTSTALRVKDAEAGEAMRCGTVYVAPPDRHLVLMPDETFALMDGHRIHYVVSSATPLFEFAGRLLGTRAIAVVLSGMGADGTDGVQAVKGAGGTVIVQDEATARYSSMPASAIATGAVDFILRADEIGPALVQLLASNGAEGAIAV